MPKWNKELALNELNQLINEIDSLYTERCGSAAHTRWLIRTMEFLNDVFGGDSLYFRSITDTEWGILYGVEGVFTTRDVLFRPDVIENRRQQVYQRQLEYTQGLLQAAADKLARSEIEDVYQGKNTGPEASSIIKVINLAERQLRKIIRSTPIKEKEVQEAFENLLIGAGIEYSRETDSIEYSSKTYTPDFTIEKADLAIEIKLCGKTEREKEMIAEVNDDILAYRTKYGNILFIIYDCGYIRDVDRFKGNFEQNENVIVKVVKH